jgi:hypothetical protein
MLAAIDMLYSKKGSADIPETQSTTYRLIFHSSFSLANKSQRQRLQRCRNVTIGKTWIHVQGVPPGHEHLNIGRIKLHSSMTLI